MNVSKFALLCMLLGSLFLLDSSAAAKGKQAAASIHGTITYKGKAPSRKSIDTSSDAACGATQQDDTLIVNKHKLQDVHVRIKSGTAGTHKAPTKPIVIVQKGCVYMPHVVGAMVGQAVAVENGDPTMHNVHAYIEGETWFNRSQPKGAPAIVERDTGAAGGVFALKCNVHPWMSSYVPITDHPYFDVTGSDGSFVIKNVPAGTYTLEAWHPKLGLKSTKVVVGKKSTKVSFAFP